ncbi:Hsp20/alpha crystallin family protein [Polyangium aurulentum]|uniref:Hsp20/alpha crystallin family protein n=1 Tax=Polyangium aurulentum TaxID=2567896 RepID=UPI001F2F6E1A|nr:Hsp20/alpha crystallin family protein [Polyangium aurulentum]
MRKGERTEQASLGRLDPWRMMTDLLRWDPFAELGTLGASGRDILPRIDVKETKDALVFRADLPGVKEDDLEISVTGNRLSVRGKRDEEERIEDDRYFLYERSHGDFERSFTLPEGFELDRIEAELKDGVLTLRVPRAAETKPRRIPVGKDKVEDKGEISGEIKGQKSGTKAAA